MEKIDSYRGKKRVEVFTGIDRIEEFASEIKGMDIGLLTNNTGVNKQSKPSAEVLLSAGLNLKVLFSPEHGYSGTEPDATAIKDSRDFQQNLPVISLYKREKLQKNIFDSIDVLLIDLQDIGCRFYTYINTMEIALELMGKKTVIILDRPNPIGSKTEGCFVEDNLASFVGHKKVPVRHGCTPAELLSYYSFNGGHKGDLKIIPLKNWDRNLFFDETDLEFIPPSPAIKNVETAIVYPMTCFFEATNIKEGRGTKSPFLWFGSSAFKNTEIERYFREVSLPGITFTPKTHLIDGKENCVGYEIDLINRKEFNCFPSALQLLSTLPKLMGQNFKWTEYQEIPGRPYIDYLLGTEDFKNGAIKVEELIRREENDLKEFQERISPFLLY